MSTKIEWCDETINPIQDKYKGKSGRGYHCTKVSPGCQNCYAESINRRFGNGLPFDGRKAEFELIQSELEKPLKWKKPKRIFVQSMGDLFHEDVPVNFLESVLATITNCPQHTFIILTKRAERLNLLTTDRLRISRTDTWPIKNLWLGVTVENDKERHRIDTLRSIPAAVRFVSFEPLLSAIGNIRLVGIHWAIVGGESGPGARPIHPNWVRSLRDQCQASGTPFFFKQHGEYIHESELFEMDNLARELDAASAESDSDGFYKVGKKAAGRLLDGKEWSEYPNQPGS